ncbi:hypothetical protein ACGTJS_11970 [Faucicola mancuniensis]|uniref:hypothetical protein n=1 Tax=Faucicola mancuniensis TaxID=1309795 RepID=UPI003977AC35
MKILDLITNPQTGRLSHTRLWANVASLIASVQFVRLNTTDWQLWLVYLGCVGGYAVARCLIAQGGSVPPTKGESL